MRKIFIVFLMLILHQSVLFAQDDVLDDVYNYESSGSSRDSGTLLVEITGSPFSGTSLVDYGMLRFKYVLSDDFTIRLGGNVDLNNTQVQQDYVTTLGNYEVNLGLEYSITRDEKFRSYVALDLIFGQQFANLESTTGASVNGSIQVPSGINYQFAPSLRSYIDGGVNASVGAEYYFGSRFYIGAEIGIRGVTRTHGEVSVDGSLYETTAKSGTVTTNMTNALRIGFKLF